MTLETYDAEALDRATVRLVFALRDSLTDAGPDRLEFWNERAKTAIEAAAAGSSTAAEMITAACRKLQIDTLSLNASEQVVAEVAPVIDANYGAWAAHAARTLTYIIALARVENDEVKAARKAKNAKPATTAETIQEGIPF